MLEAAAAVSLTALFCERAAARFAVSTPHHVNSSEIKNLVMLSGIACAVALLIDLVRAGFSQLFSIQITALHIAVFSALFIFAIFFWSRNAAVQKSALFKRIALQALMIVFLSTGFSIAISQLSGVLNWPSRIAFLIASALSVPASATLIRRANLQTRPWLHGWPMALICIGLFGLIFYLCLHLLERNL
jgi:hypothetical protein